MGVILAKVIGVAIVAPVFLCLALFAGMTGLAQGQWLGANLDGRGVDFRRNVRDYSTKKAWPNRLLKRSWSVNFILIYALIFPVLRSDAGNWKFLGMGQAVIAVGMIVGMVFSLTSKRPVSWKVIVPVMVVGSLVTLFLSGKLFPVSQSVLVLMYGFVVAVCLVNALYFIKSLANRRDDLITAVEELRSDTAKLIATDLLKGQGHILTQVPRKMMKRHQGYVDHYYPPVSVGFLDSGVAVGVNDGFAEENFDPMAPGTETVPRRDMWIIIPFAQLESRDVDRMIGYAETCYRLRESGLKLRIKGVAKVGAALE